MPQQEQGFEVLGVNAAILKSLDEMGFEEPTPIQARAIPLILKGKDLIGQAQTGTGKTAAFAIPILQQIKPGIRNPQALVMAPTRELALQVAGDVAQIGKYLQVRVLAICGGHPIERQIKALRSGVSVVVGTPGRIMDHINRRTLKLDRIHVFVLDEADEMLDMGFLDDIETIMSHLPAERQTICFSAIMPEPIVRITKRYMQDPVGISIDREEPTASTIDQAYFEVRPKDKVDSLTRIIDHETISRAIVFCRTKRGCDELASALQSRGYLAEAIHGDLNQAQRNRTLAGFREGQIELLVATDVAARGLDVENVTHVINYDIAHSPEYHVHRIGRTGRAGREGTAFTLIQPREFRHLRLIERATRSRIPRRRVPTASDIAERTLELVEERITSLIDRGTGDKPKYVDLASRLLDDHEPERLVATLIWAMSENRTPAEPEADRVRTSGKAPEFPDTGAEPGYTRLFMNVGSRHRVTPADFVRTIAREANIPGGLIGAIDIYDDFTFVEVPKELGRDVLDAMKSASIQGRSIQAEPARPLR